jgi:DNA-binding FadR family transcriptional regulator
MDLVEQLVRMGWLVPPGGAVADSMHRRIAGDLREEIESARLGPGRQPPADGLVREQFAAWRNSIRDAIELLSTVELARTRPRRGGLTQRGAVP